jgi:hypothetical protein
LRKKRVHTYIIGSPQLPHRPVVGNEQNRSSGTRKGDKERG